MAKIVTHEKQKKALQIVNDELKTLLKMKSLLETETEEGKVVITVVGTNGDKKKADYSLDPQQIQVFVKGYYKEAVGRVQRLLEENHIVLDDEEMELVEYI